MDEFNNMSFAEQMVMMGEAGIDLHQIFCLSEIEDGMLPIKYWTEGMDEPLLAGYAPVEMLTNIETLVSDPEAAHYLGFDKFVDAETEESLDNLMNLDDYRD